MLPALDDKLQPDARLARIDAVSHADVAVLGVPFDSGVSYRPGARFGPSHIRESSRLLRPYNPALQVPVFANQQVADAGDLAVNPFSIDEAIATVERGARGLLERAPFVLTLGGDHTVALPMLRAVSAVHGPVAVVHFDAHPDTWDTDFGAAYTHGTPASAPPSIPRRSWTRTPSSASRWYQPPRWSTSACPAWPNASPSGSATARSTSPSTSTSSTR